MRIPAALIAAMVILVGYAVFVSVSRHEQDQEARLEHEHATIERLIATIENESARPLAVPLVPCDTTVALTLGPKEFYDSHTHIPRNAVICQVRIVSNGQTAAHFVYGVPR